MQDIVEKQFCPFLSTPEITMLCNKNCALGIPTVEPPYVTCSIRLIAGEITGENDEDAGENNEETCERD